MRLTGFIHAAGLVVIGLVLALTMFSLGIGVEQINKGCP